MYLASSVTKVVEGKVLNEDLEPEICVEQIEQADKGSLSPSAVVTGAAREKQILEKN